VPLLNSQTLDARGRGLKTRLAIRPPDPKIRNHVRLGGSIPGMETANGAGSRPALTF